MSDVVEERIVAVLGDAALMAAVASGDRLAFERLYEAHRVRAFRLAYGVLLDRDEAREAVQEAFIRLHEHADRWEPHAAVGTWIHRVVLNHCLSLKRRLLRFWNAESHSRGDARSDLERASRAPSPETASSLGEAMSIVFATLAELAPRQRAVLTLYLEGETLPRENAPLVGLTPNATRVTLHRALERLRAALAEKGIDSVPEDTFDHEEQI